MGQASGTNAKGPRDKSRSSAKDTRYQRSALPTMPQSDAVVQSYTHQQQQHPPGNSVLLDNEASVPGVGHHASPFGKSVVYPIVLSYADQDVKHLLSHKCAVYVAVESMGWQPIPMTPSSESFYAILQLPPGHHNYRFLVNNKEVVDRTQPLAPTTPSSSSFSSPPPPPPPQEAAAPPPPPPALPPADGKAANCVLLSEGLHHPEDADTDAEDESQGWGQEEVLFEDIKAYPPRKYPPIMPLHLRYTPLNTPPTPFRCSTDGKMVLLTDEASGATRPSPEHLPLPLSVTVNHVYFQRRDDHAVLGMTARYGNKCSTLVYYTSLGTQEHPQEEEEAGGRIAG